jgi:hypothetical protein
MAVLKVSWCGIRYEMMMAARTVSLSEASSAVDK